MKKTLLAAALCAAWMLPATAAEVVHLDGPSPDFTFDFDVGELLAQAEDARAAAAEAAGKARAESERARAEGERIRIEMQDGWRDFAENMQDSMTFMFADRAGRGRLVKGAPYAAEVVTERNQTLADGNVITHRNVNRVYRDAEGRTRQETYRNDKLRSVYISDPVAKTAYTLIPERKIAVEIPRMDMHFDMQLPRPPRPPRAPRDGDTDAKGRTSTTETIDSEGRRRVIVRTVDGDGVPGVREEVRVQVVRVGDDANIAVAPAAPTPPTPPSAPHMAPVPPVPPVPPMIPGVHTMRFEDMGHLGKGDTKSLGTKEFDGVKAEGKSTTWTIPAGKIGNRNPINVTSETWYSPDLQVTVYSRYNDPRAGESVYRLASIKRAEPQADLFKVPADYTMRGRKPKDKDKAEKK